MSSSTNSKQERHAKQTYVRKRSRARRLAMQSLYQWQLNPVSASGLIAQHEGTREFEDADAEYFAQLVRQSVRDSDTNTAIIAEHADRPVDQIDPLETAVLMIALTELRHHLEVPYKVVLNEAIELTRRFGATDGYKYVNAILDGASATLRSAERNG